ncbi:MAG: RodZ domain-containing protein [Methylophilus sp.]
MVNTTKSKAEDILESSTETPSLEPVTEAVVSTSNADTHWSNCGGVLKQTREKLGLTTYDISSQLRLSLKQIEALEADLFSKLPEPTIVRGFIRNYAKILKIDAQPILAAYSELSPQSTPYAVEVKANANRSVIGENKTGFSPAIFISLLLLFSIIGGLFYYYTQHILPQTKDTVAQVVATADIEQGQALTPPAEFALPPAEREDLISDTSNTSNISTSNTSDTTNTTDTSSATNSESSASTNNSPETTTTVVESNTLATLNNLNPAAKLAKLSFIAYEDTWVSVTDANGKKVYDEILPAGSTKTVEAEPSVSVIVGNEPGTSLSMNGKKIDMAPYTRNNIARLKLD